jgi:N-acyl-D-aspartate/D-glutamate deacylase
MGSVNRPATAKELDKMRALVEQGMKDGAFGLSSGLIYIPGVFGSTAEIVELAKIAGGLGGHYTSHVRSEGARLVEAVREAITIGEQGGLPIQVTHHKAVGKTNWGKSAETLRLIDEARARGIDATIDQYPYTSVGGVATTYLPPWALQSSARESKLKLPAASAASAI